MRRIKSRRVQAVELQGKVVAITGGARGIGRSIAAALARAGARVAIGDVDLGAAEEAAAELGEGVVALAVDVSDRDSVERFADEVEDQLGPLDVWVNNAGILLVGPFLEEDDAATERQIAINLMGVVHGMRVALARMRPRDRGQIVNIASGASYTVPPGEVTYAATKHAVLALTDGVREECRGTGLTITAVFPGLVNTELAKGTAPPRASKWITPDDVAEGVVKAIREQRLEVFVPRGMAPLVRMSRAATARGRMWLSRLFGMEAVATQTDPAERADYMERIGLSPEQAGADSGSDGAGASSTGDA
jgi:NAD(P)-dependent dehydrogenase (short-subunit alcohol dehydrogenase family)